MGNYTTTEGSPKFPNITSTDQRASTTSKLPNNVEIELNNFCDSKVNTSRGLLHTRHADPFFKDQKDDIKLASH